MKKVYCPKTEEVILIDEKKEKDWMTKYRHNSGKPFANPVVEETQFAEEEVEIVKTSTGEVVTLEEAAEDLGIELIEEDVDFGVEALRVLYKEKLGKKVPNRYKNDVEWILSKIEE